MAKKKFDTKLYLGLLNKMIDPLPSDDVMDNKLVKMIQYFLKSNDKTDIGVWNFYKQALDACVHSCLGSSFILTLLDLEPYYEAPIGSYNYGDRSIEDAPWRKKDYDWSTAGLKNNAS